MTSPVKQYTIHLALSIRKGTSKKLQFIGTKQEAMAHARKYISAHHLSPEMTYLSEGVK